MKSKQAELVLETLNLLGSALCDANHTWTSRQRWYYQRAAAILNKETKE